MTASKNRSKANHTADSQALPQGATTPSTGHQTKTDQITQPPSPRGYNRARVMVTTRNPTSQQLYLQISQQLYLQISQQLYLQISQQLYLPSNSTIIMKKLRL